MDPMLLVLQPPPPLVLNIRRPCSSYQRLCGCNKDRSLRFTFSKRNVVILVLKVAREPGSWGGGPGSERPQRSYRSGADTSPLSGAKKELLLSWGELQRGEVRGRSQTSISQTYANLIASRPLKVVEKKTPNKTKLDVTYSVQTFFIWHL